MFILITILIIGGAYIYWRYTSAANKGDFFKSHLFVAISGNMAIMLIAYCIVNFTAPEETFSETEIENTYETDTTYAAVAAKTAQEHYQLISYLCENEKVGKVTKHYRLLSASGNPARKSIGEFAFGLIAYYNNSYEQAVERFNNVPDKDLPVLNYCIGKAYLAMHDTSKAIASFTKELEVKDGMRRSSLQKLVTIYGAHDDFNSITVLYKTFPEANSLSPGLARRTYWHSGDLEDYIIWVYKSIYLETSLAGILAAVFIALVWLIYMAGLNAFGTMNIGKVSLMFFFGMVYIPIIFAFNDFTDANLSWNLTDSFWNDLAYSVCMIGVPEEFTKAVPLFLYLLFGGRFKEPIDYIICASASALGFAFLENILYFNELNRGIIHGRAYLAAIGHMMDSSIVAYGFVIGWFKRTTRKALIYTVPIGFLAGSITHGIYDVLLFHNYIFFFLIFFIFSVQVWIIIINNCLNNSPRFSYQQVKSFNRSRLFITLALTAIFAFEYLVSAFTSGSSAAHQEFLANIPFAGMMIIFFSSNLSSFDLVPGYWRDVYFSSRERRGYGTIPQGSVFIRWYFVNSIQAHNYVGLKTVITNDTYNKVLADYIPQPVTGTIIDRIILAEEKDLDPHWFLIKLDNPILFPSDSNEYVLVKHRYQKDSLLDGMEAQAFFKAIPDLSLLESRPMVKESFPFYGWVYLAMTEVSL